MKTQISRYLGTLAIAAALLTTTTSAFAATPGSVNPTLYDDSSAETGDDVATGLDFGGAALGVGSAVVGAAAGNTDSGQITSGSLAVGSAVLTSVAAPIVVLGTR
jgi:hypothetical protein